MQLLQQAQMHFKVPPAQAGLAGTGQTRCVVIPQACDGLAAQMEQQQQPTAGTSLPLSRTCTQEQLCSHHQTDAATPGCATCAVPELCKSCSTGLLLIKPGTHPVVCSC